MKKNYLVVLLICALAMALGLAACSQGGGSSSAEPSGASSEAASADSPSASAEAASDASTAESAEAESAEAESAESADGAAADGSAYGYAGDDPVEVAVYKYMVEEVSKNFEKADVSIPTVNIVNVNYTNPDEVLVSGDFWVYNYNIDGDTLECVSGGNFPGVMHLGKDGEGYVVTSFDVVADGADFDSSAKELFGDNYDAFMEVYSNSDARDELRKITVSDYVNLNGLDITQYQDYGWDPVQLYK